MAKQFLEINERLQSFIEAQKVFFVATAGAEGKINLSPKGMDSLRVIDKTTVVWLNLTGSGNETAAHVQENGRMTIMLCAFEGQSMILRLYGHALEIHETDAAWETYIKLFPPDVGARQVFKLQIELVQTSCGFGVPVYDYVEERDLLQKWADQKGRDGVRAYWKEKNHVSLDGKSIYISEDG